MGAERIPNEKSLTLGHKSKILPNPLLGSYKLEKTQIRLLLETVDLLLGVTKGVLKRKQGRVEAKRRYLKAHA